MSKECYDGSYNGYYHGYCKTNPIEIVCDDIKNLLIKKNQDYTAGQAIFANFEAQMEFHDGTVVGAACAELAKKFTRLKSMFKLRKEGKFPNFESLEDSIQDIAGYALIAQAAIREELENNIFKERTDKILSDIYKDEEEDEEEDEHSPECTSSPKTSPKTSPEVDEIADIIEEQALFKLEEGIPEEAEANPYKLPERLNTLKEKLWENINETFHKDELEDELAENIVGKDTPWEALRETSRERKAYETELFNKNKLEIKRRVLNTLHEELGCPTRASVRAEVYDTGETQED